MPARFDDRKLLEDLVRQMMLANENLDGLDVALSKIAPVDLDMLHGCIREARKVKSIRESLGVAQVDFRKAA